MVKQNKCLRLVVLLMYLQTCEKSIDVGYKLGKDDGVVITTLGTYTSSSVKQIFNNAQPTHGGVRKIL